MLLAYFKRFIIYCQWLFDGISLIEMFLYDFSPHALDKSNDESGLFFQLPPTLPTLPNLPVIRMSPENDSDRTSPSSQEPVNFNTVFSAGVSYYFVFTDVPTEIDFQFCFLEKMSFGYCD